MNNNQFIQMALSSPGTIVQPHFRRTAFKVTGKKAFATLDETFESANILLTPDEQESFCKMDEPPDNYNLKILFTLFQR